MKVIAVFVALLASVTAFAPQPSCSRSSTQLQETLFDTIKNMDLFAPNKDVNTYGARKSKNLKVGNIGANSYVPNGLTAAEYNKIRAAEQKKKDANYDKNVKKAFKFVDFTDWYLKRGTAEGGSFLKAPGRGHTFAKTKFDWSGVRDDGKKIDSTKGSIFKKK